MAIAAIITKAPIVEATSHASCNLQVEWKQSCARVMGLHDDNDDELSEHHDDSPADIHILNLMNDDNGNEDTVTENAVDENHWMDNANQFSASITQMADMIYKNHRAYVTFDLTDEEASVLESTVLSFSATAANQIDALRGAIDVSQSSNVFSSPDYLQYCHGIVASLMLRLREQVANPMATLQKQRTRSAMAIYQQPLACRLVVPSHSRETVWDQLVEDDEDFGASGGQTFRPQHAAPSMSNDFINTYTNDEMQVSVRPSSLFSNKRNKIGDNADSTPPPAIKQVKFSSKANQIRQERTMYHEQQHQHQLEEQHHEQDRIEFQKEAVLLEASLQNDLDTVHQVEQQMTDITTLLSQFANLVSEQQEEIVTIHETTVSSKENVQKGQESLIDAKERTKKSKHRLATLVFFIAMILLFFNYVTP